MLAPSKWVPNRLPLWGAILGVVAGFFAGFVLNIPSKVFGEVIPASVRGFGALILVIFYAIMWMLVGIAYRKVAV